LAVMGYGIMYTIIVAVGWAENPPLYCGRWELAVRWKAEPCSLCRILIGIGGTMLVCQ
jgi:hypothetical protein